MIFSFSSGIASIASTIFWNMVLFLEDRGTEWFWITCGIEVLNVEETILNPLLEVKGEIGGNDADFKQMLDCFKLALLKVLEDVQILHKEKMSWTKSICLPRDERSDCCSRETKEIVLKNQKL